MKLDMFTTIIGSVILTIGIFIIIMAFYQNKDKGLEDRELLDKKWNAMIDLWVDYKLENPYQDILTYDSEVNNGGHLQFFENCSSELDEMMVTLEKSLPEDIYNNLKKAYDIYKSKEIDINTVDEYVDASMQEDFTKYDMFYYENDEKVNDILWEYAKTIKLDDK